MLIPRIFGKLSSVVALNQKEVHKTIHFHNFQNLELDYSQYPVQVLYASFGDVRLLYNSEKESLAKLAPNLSIKACYLIELQLLSSRMSNWS